jgi:hypothetical protein
MITLVCRSCGGILDFTEHGWEHRDDVRPCNKIRVAWPPPSDDDFEDDAAFDPVSGR